MNKQTLIDDYKTTIERLQKECTEKTDFNIKLMERVKELEQKLNAQFAEMEEKLTVEELKNYEINKTVNKIEKVIEPYQNNFEAEALSLPVAIESILERMKQKGDELLAEKNAFQIGYNEHITRVKLLEEKLTIALNSLNYIAILDNNYIVAKLDAQQALQKIKEVNQ